MTEVALLQLREDLSYDEEPVKIVDHKEQVLRRWIIFLCKGSMAKSFRKGSYMVVGIRDRVEVSGIASVKWYVKFRELNFF